MASSDEIGRMANIVLVGEAFEMSRTRRARTVAEWAVILDALDVEDEEDDKPPKRSRDIYERPNYAQSTWGAMLVDAILSDPTSRVARQFRRRFRIPNPVFLEIMKLERGWFPSEAKDIADRRCIPVELKVLATLQTLSRGACFDGISQMSLMCEWTACQSVHTECGCFAEELYDIHVRLPTGAAMEKATVEGADGIDEISGQHGGDCLEQVNRECAQGREMLFGRLEDRLRMLKLPLLDRKKSDINNMFFTCCILHTIIHSFDGLDVLEGDADWDCADGLHDPWVADPTYGISSIGAQGGFDGGEEKPEIEAGHDVLKRQLNTSFMCRKEHHRITWLKRQL